MVSSLPHYTKGNDKQRGDGFNASIEAQELNKVGYGVPDSDLQLILFTILLSVTAYRPASARERFQKALWKILASISIAFCDYQFAHFRYLDYLITSENYEDLYALVKLQPVCGVQCHVHQHLV